MSSQLHPWQTQLAGLTGWYFWNLECLVESCKCQWFLLKPGRLPLYGPNPALRAALPALQTALWIYLRQLLGRLQRSSCWRSQGRPCLTACCSHLLTASQKTHRRPQVLFWALVSLIRRKHPKKISNCIYITRLHTARSLTPVLAPLLPLQCKFSVLNCRSRRGQGGVLDSDSDAVKFPTQ